MMDWIDTEFGAQERAEHPRRWLPRTRQAAEQRPDVRARATGAGARARQM